MDPNVKLMSRQGKPLTDSGRYQRLIGKLNYLTITCPDISFAVSTLAYSYSYNHHVIVIGML